MLPTITPNKIELPPGTRLNFPETLADYEYLLTQLGDRQQAYIGEQILHNVLDDE